MSTPDMYHPDLFLEYVPLDPQASEAETLLAEKTSRPAAPDTCPVDIVFKDPLAGFTW